MAKKKLPAEIAEWFRREGVKGGRKSAASMTPEERTERARKASRIRWTKRNQVRTMTKSSAIIVAALVLSAPSFAEHIKPARSFTVHMMAGETDAKFNVVPLNFVKHGGPSTVSRIGTAFIKQGSSSYYIGKGIPGPHSREIYYPAEDGSWVGGAFQRVNDALRLVTTAKTWEAPLPARKKCGTGLVADTIGYEAIGEQKLTTLHMRFLSGLNMADVWYWEEAGCIPVQTLLSDPKLLTPELGDHKTGTLFVRLDNGNADTNLLLVPDNYEEVDFLEPERRARIEQFGPNWETLIVDPENALRDVDALMKRWKDGHEDAVTRVKIGRVKAILGATVAVQ